MTGCRMASSIRDGSHGNWQNLVFSRFSRDVILTGRSEKGGADDICMMIFWTGFMYHFSIIFKWKKDLREWEFKHSWKNQNEIWVSLYDESDGSITPLLPSTQNVKKSWRLLDSEAILKRVMDHCKLLLITAKTHNSSSFFNPLDNKIHENNDMRLKEWIRSRSTSGLPISLFRISWKW